MRILLTGAGGQLGRDLSRRLTREGLNPVALNSGALDITDKKKVLAAVKEHGPEVIINCGAYTRVDLAEKERERAFAVNRDGAANLAEGAANAGAALLHVSTDFVFDGAKSTPYGEGDDTNPLSVYGTSKLAGEEEIIKRLKRHIIVRASWLYGSYGSNFVKTILRLAAEREALRVVYDQAGTPTWTSDLCGAVVEILKGVKAGREIYGVYHYSNEGVASWYDFADFIIEEARTRGFPIRCRSVEPVLTAEYPTPAKRPAYSVLNKRKIKSTFGISIPHWRVSLREMLNELKNHTGA